MKEKDNKPDIDQPKGLTKRQKNIQMGCFAAMVIVPLIIFIYIKANPLVFNESALGHAHCMTAIYVALSLYASQNDGVFPYSENGYADALAKSDCSWAISGPGYSIDLTEDMKTADIPESKCGRVYIQGLKETNDELAFLFDKKATPGGDHCHLPQRMWMPLGREVQKIGGPREFIPNEKWEVFAKKQIDLLVKAGITREKAEWYYDQVDKVQP